MKRTISLGFLGLTLFLAAGCFSGKTPRETAEGYLSSLANADFGRASRFTTREGRANLEQLRQIFRQLSTEQRSKFRMDNWEITAIESTKETAKVAFTFDTVKQGQLLLVHTNGFWYVQQRLTVE